MPVIKLNSVTHKSGGEIEGNVGNEQLVYAADQGLPDSYIYNMAIGRLIMRVSGKNIQEYQSGAAGQFSINYEDKSAIKLFELISSSNSEGVYTTEERFVRTLTEEEVGLFLPVLQLLQEAWAKENPSAPDIIS